MSTSELRSKLRGTSVADWPFSDNLPVVVSDAGGKYGEVQVTNGRLTYADREWSTSGSDGVEAFLAAIYSLTQKGARACVIAHDRLPLPQGPQEEAAITCGPRGVTMRKGKTFELVIETIGSFATAN